MVQHEVSSCGRLSEPRGVQQTYDTAEIRRGGVIMYGVFGGYTQWAVVFLIIFVLFFLLVPGYGAAAAY
ncbi:hypothetical protein GCM10025858_02280 [Alicyclobacillus sacchari]|nr:hypothetical protein GCM10025858_02280 [Alicyclobacillus sacchari]